MIPVTIGVPTDGYLTGEDDHHHHHHGAYVNDPTCNSTGIPFDTTPHSYIDSSPHHPRGCQSCVQGNAVLGCPVELCKTGYPCPPLPADNPGELWAYPAAAPTATAFTQGVVPPAPHEQSTSEAGFQGVGVVRIPVSYPLLPLLPPRAAKEQLQRCVREEVEARAAAARRQHSIKSSLVVAFAIFVVLETCIIVAACSSPWDVSGQIAFASFASIMSLSLISFAMTCFVTLSRCNSGAETTPAPAAREGSHTEGSSNASASSAASGESRPLASAKLPVSQKLQQQHQAGIPAAPLTEKDAWEAEKREKLRRLLARLWWDSSREAAGEGSANARSASVGWRAFSQQGQADSSTHTPVQVIRVVVEP